MKKYALLISCTFLLVCPRNIKEEEVERISTSILSQNYISYITGLNITLQDAILLAGFSRQYKIPLNILAGLVFYESGFNRLARNDNGYSNERYLGLDQGLMQLNSRNYYFFREAFNNGKDYNPYDAVTNLSIGCQYLIYIKSRLKYPYNNWWCVLYRYNGGGKHSAEYADRITKF